MTLALGALLGEDVTQMRAFTLVSAGTGALKSLRGPAITFLLVRHSVFSLTQNGANIVTHSIVRRGGDDGCAVPG